MNRTGAACPSGGIDHEARREIVACADRRRPRRRAGRGAEADFTLNWVAGRRPRAVFLRAEDGLVQDRPASTSTSRPGKRLGGCRRRRSAPGASQIGLSDMAGVLLFRGKGARPRRADERLRQFAAGPVLAQELRHQQHQGSRRQEDRQSGGRRRAHDVAGAGQGERHRSELGHLGQHRRQRQARRAEGQDDRRHDLVLQPAPRLRARARRRHGLPRLEGRRPQPVRQFDHRQRRVAEGQQGQGRASSSRSRRGRSPPASRRRSPASRRWSRRTARCSTTTS